MIAKITIHQVLSVEIDGQEVQGEFRIKDDWEGMVKLECSSPHEIIIIRSPGRPVNHFDIIPKMLGGNKKNGEEVTIEAEVVMPPYGFKPK